MQSFLTKFRSPPILRIIPPSPLISRRIITNNQFHYPTSPSFKSIHTSTKLSSTSKGPSNITSIINSNKFSPSTINRLSKRIRNNNNNKKQFFHSTNSNKDILFVSIPAIKGALLQLVRITLIILPFVSSFSPSLN